MRAYFHPHILTVLVLGFASGLPLPLVAGTLAARLTDAGASLAAIGLFAYVMVPYSLKFAWAPLVDHLRLPWLTRRFGQRSGWMLLTQAALLVALLALGSADPAAAPLLTALLALLVAFLSASQDIVIDAYRAEFLEQERYGEGAAAAVLGYRLGAQLVGGALALSLADHLPWSQVYTLMAGLMVVGMAALLRAGEPKRRRESAPYAGPRDWLAQAVIGPFAQFARAHPRWLALLAFVALYRMPDGFIGFMSTPFFLNIGFTKTEIAAVAKVYGLAASIGGAILGGLAVRRFGVWPALMTMGVAQMFSNLAYLLVAHAGPEIWALMTAITLDNLAGGAVTAVAVAFLMRLCDVNYTATQYALLSSLAALAGMTLAGAAGWIAAQYGWVAMFTLSSIIGLPALLLLAGLRNLPAMRRHD